VSTMSDLLAQHTRLSAEAVEHLQRVVAEWQLLADTSFADFLLWVPLDDSDEVVLLHHVAFLDGDLGERSGGLGEHRDLHLHGLEDHHGVALADELALVANDLQHIGHHLGVDLLGHRTIPALDGTAFGNPTTIDRRPADNTGMAILSGNDRVKDPRRTPMSKRARKRRDRKKSSANHGKRPHS